MSKVWVQIMSHRRQTLSPLSLVDLRLSWLTHVVIDINVPLAATSDPVLQHQAKQRFELTGEAFGDPKPFTIQASHSLLNFSYSWWQPFLLFWTKLLHRKCVLTGMRHDWCHTNPIAIQVLPFFTKVVYCQRPWIGEICAIPVSLFSKLKTRDDKRH